MFPPPTTTATSTPRSWTRLTVRAMEWMRSASTPYWSGPISASPESFSNTRRKAGLPFPAPGSDTRETYLSGCLLPDPEAREPPDHDVLARLGRDLRAQVLDRAAVVTVRVDVLLMQEHDLLQPLAHPPLGDLLAYLGRLGVVGLLLEDSQLAGTLVLVDLILGHVARRRGGDVHRDLAREVDELLVTGHEVGLAIDLHQRADLPVEVRVVRHGSLRGLALTALGRLGLTPDPQQLERLVVVAAGLLEGLLALHHARAGPV